MRFRTNSVSRNIYAWICAVITCGVQDFALADESFTAQELPWRLFTCKSLVVLRIRGLFLLVLPTYVRLPCLRGLRLLGVLFSNEASIQRLISSCPVLEQLTIEIQHDFVQVINISVPSLERLSIIAKSVHNRAEINAPRLKHLLLRGNCIIDDFLVNFSCPQSLDQAAIDGRLNISTLNGISQIKHLHLGSSFYQDLYDRACPLPTFKDVKKLELSIGSPMYGNVLLPILLESTPNVEVLIFPEGLVLPKADGDYADFFSWEPVVDPECLLLHLKTIEIFKFVGFEHELYLVLDMLECAKVLEKLIIHTFDFSTMPGLEEEVERDRVRADIRSSKRGSSHCEIVFTA